MEIISVLKGIFVVSCCGIVFFGVWALHQFKTRQQSALAIGFADCGIFAIITAFLILVFGVRSPIPPGGRKEMLVSIFQIISIVALGIILGSMIAVGCSSSEKVRRISKRVFLVSAGVWILTFMAEMVTIY